MEIVGYEVVEAGNPKVMREARGFSHVRFTKNKLDTFYIGMYHIDDLKGLKKVVDTIKENNIKTEW